MLGKCDSLFTACQARAWRFKLRDSPGQIFVYFSFLGLDVTSLSFPLSCVSPWWMHPVCLETVVHVYAHGGMYLYPYLWRTSFPRWSMKHRAHVYVQYRGTVPLQHVYPEKRERDSLVAAPVRMALAWCQSLRHQKKSKINNK
jgi:hypothetical protein